MESKATQRFRAAIARYTKADRKNGPRPIETRARDFAEVKEPDLTHAWVLSEIERFIRIEDERSKQKRNPEEKAQLEFLGEDFQALFSGPRHRLPLKDGTRRHLEAMTVMQLRQSAVAIRARISPRASQQAAYLEQLADQMSPYARRHPRLTFGDYLELRTAGVIA
jgi:hypothetical protein